MRICDYCGIEKKANYFLSKNVTKNQSSIRRYVARIYAKHPTGVPYGSSDYPKSFQGWIYKEHGKNLCWDCSLKVLDPSFKEEILNWIKKVEAIGLESAIKKTRITQKTKELTKRMKKPAKIKKPKTRKDPQAAVAIFEKSVNNVLKSIKTLKKHWNCNTINERIRSKAMKYITDRIGALEENEKEFRI